MKQSTLEITKLLLVVLLVSEQQDIEVSNPCSSVADLCKKGIK